MLTVTFGKRREAGFGQAMLVFKKLITIIEQNVLILQQVGDFNAKE